MRVCQFRHFRTEISVDNKFLPRMDSNHDKQLQRLLCYHYTTGQIFFEVAYYSIGPNPEQRAR